MWLTDDLQFPIKTGCLLVDAVVDKQLSNESRQQSSGQSYAKATPRTVKCPPQAQRQSSQSKWELHIIGKVQFL